jgi:hypothetical protein
MEVVEHHHPPPAAAGSLDMSEGRVDTFPIWGDSLLLHSICIWNPRGRASDGPLKVRRIV